MKIKVKEPSEQDIQEMVEDLCHSIKLANAIVDAEYPGTGDRMINAFIRELEKLRKKPEQGCTYDTEGERTKVVFKRITEFPKPCFDFGCAIEAVKDGKRVARKGWNGKNQFVELGVNFSYYDPSGICEETHHMDIGSAALVFVGTRGRQVGWLASQTDMLAEDWYIVE